MLLEAETLSPQPQNLFAPPSAAVPGTVTVGVSIVNTQLVLTLSGGGTGWFITNGTGGSTIHLQPGAAASLPLWYELSFSMAEGDGNLLGLQISKPGGGNATTYVPAVSGTATVNLLNNLAEGDSELYTLGVGVEIDSSPVWFDDPTISFDPQGT